VTSFANKDFFTLDFKRHGHISDGPTLKKKFGEEIRSKLIKVLARYRQSGMGCIPEDRRVKDILTVFSSHIFPFFNGDTALYYAYVNLVFFDLLESASADMTPASSFNSASVGTASSLSPRSQSTRRRSEVNTFHPNVESDDRKRENKHRADAAGHASEAARNASASQKLKYQGEMMQALQIAQSTADVHRQNGTEVPGHLAKYISHLSDQLDKFYD
jgi:hypothetical protein